MRGWWEADVEGVDETRLGVLFVNDHFVRAHVGRTVLPPATVCTRPATRVYPACNRVYPACNRVYPAYNPRVPGLK